MNESLFKKKGEKYMGRKNKITEPIEVVQREDLSNDTIITLKDILKADPCEDELYWFIDHCKENSIDIINGVSFKDIKIILKEEKRYTNIKWCEDNLTVENNLPDGTISVEDFVNNIVDWSYKFIMYRVPENPKLIQHIYWERFYAEIKTGKFFLFPYDKSNLYIMLSYQCDLSVKSIIRFMDTGGKFYIFDSMDHFVDWRRKK